MEWIPDGVNCQRPQAPRLVASRPHEWHIPIVGSGPDLLLLHGTGGSTHGWSGVLPALSKHFRVIAPDLPGHGLTRLGNRHRSRPTLMAEDLWTLMRVLDLAPRIVVGHSAGSALALHMAQASRRPHEITHIIGLNAALDGFQGAAAWLFPMAARAMSATPGLAQALSRIARDPRRVDQLMSATGSVLSDEALGPYRKLLASPAHLDGTLKMMAQWSTAQLPHFLKTWNGRLDLLVSESDKTVDPAVSRRAATLAPNACIHSLGPYGHLVAEERPDLVAAALLTILTNGS